MRDARAFRLRRRGEQGDVAAGLVGDAVLGRPQMDVAQPPSVLGAGDQRLGAVPGANDAAMCRSWKPSMAASVVPGGPRHAGQPGRQAVDEGSGRRRSAGRKVMVVMGFLYH